MHGEIVVVRRHYATGFPVVTIGNHVTAFFHHFFIFFSLGGGMGGVVGVEGWKWRRCSGRGVR